MPNPPQIQASSMPEPWHESFYHTVGANRANGYAQIDAQNDIEAIKVWLARATSSPHTHRVYRKEIERLLLWAKWDSGSCFSAITVEQMQRYSAFLRNPQPFDLWCNKQAKLPRTHPEWRPFSGPLTAKSQVQALRIISICFTFLVDAGYLQGNPCRLLAINKIAPSVQKQPVERYLEQDLWDTFIRTLEELPEQTNKERKHKERTLFLFQLLYLQSPRVSEVANATMNSFYARRGRWWWEVTGKGNKEAIIPVSDTMIHALKRYRLFLGLPPLPAAHDDSPLLRSIGGKKGLSPDMVYRLVKSAVSQAADVISAYDTEGAQRLRLASTHWFRHTAITHQADKNIDIRFIQASARHSSILTTQRYLHHDMDTWHDAMKKHAQNAS